MKVIHNSRMSAEKDYPYKGLTLQDIPSETNLFLENETNCCRISNMLVHFLNNSSGILKFLPIYDHLDYSYWLDWKILFQFDQKPRIQHQVTLIWNNFWRCLTHVRDKERLMHCGDRWIPAQMKNGTICKVM